MHRCVRSCGATPVTWLCTFVNMCVNVVVVATCACFDLVCRLVCVCLKEHVQSHVYVQVHSCILCVLCVHLCIPVHTCVVHACAWTLTWYNVLQCYKKRVTVQPCEYNHTLLQLQQQLCCRYWCDSTMYQHGRLA